MKKQHALWMSLLLALLLAACDEKEDSDPGIVVNSLEDVAAPSEGTVTLRSALAAAADGQPIVFDERLDGATIELSIVGEEHTVLMGEVMGMREEESGLVSYLVGYFERDYGRSALYARKRVVIDASSLPLGITLSWVGGDQDPARVLAVYGNLTLKNVSVRGGRLVAEAIPSEDQPWTLARGGALAVWGVAQLVDCELYDNHIAGDFDSSRDRGAFGGGLYANIVDMENCVVSGNSVLGAGAAGGGVFSVGGAESYNSVSYVEGSSITGNRISGLFAYGGGVFSDGGGIGNSKTLSVTNSTVARNLVEPELAPGMPSFLLGMGYWRGGGIYVSNGNLTVKDSTVVENEVYGVPRTGDLGKPNLAGGIAATIGNAHAIEDMIIGHSVVAGNVVHEVGGSSYDHDVFTGSTFHFRSLGYNRIGVIDFSQMLVPVGNRSWASLCRRHYPQQGDEDDVDVEDVLNLSSGIAYSDSILSVGVDAPDPAVLYYEPSGSSLDQVPAASYVVTEVYGEYALDPGGVDDFLSILLLRLENHYRLHGDPGFAEEFTTDFETFLQTVDSDPDTAGTQPYEDPWGNPILTLARTLFYGPGQTWPKELENYPFIEFWHQLDDALLDEEIPGMGPEVLGDDAWAALFSSGELVENRDITMNMNENYRLTVRVLEVDQLGAERPADALSDIGAIEIGSWGASLAAPEAIVPTSASSDDTRDRQEGGWEGALEEPSPLPSDESALADPPSTFIGSDPADSTLVTPAVVSSAQVAAVSNTVDFRDLARPGVDFDPEADSVSVLGSGLLGLMLLGYGAMRLARSDRTETAGSRIQGVRD